MRIDTLEDLYLEQLKDIYSANQQALDVVVEMLSAARDGNLVSALKAGIVGINSGLAAIEQMALCHDEDLHGRLCSGMEGLTSDARRQALIQPFGEDATRDAMIITQYLRLVHHAIAGYSCLAAFAFRLELDADHIAFKRCLDASYDGDRAMTKLATGNFEPRPTAWP